MTAKHRILLMRHPETLANADHRLSGRSDVDLTPAGEVQMFRAIDALVAWRPDRIWTSPLSRCKAIAEEAANTLSMTCEVKEVLEEIEFGSAQGLTLKELQAKGFDFPWTLDASGRSCPAPGAESFEDLIERGRCLARELTCLEGRTACVTHGGFTRAFLAAVFDTPLDTFWHVRIPNVTSQILTSDGNHLTLCAIALAPEEVVRRARHPELLGRDTTESLSESDD